MQTLPLTEVIKSAQRTLPAHLRTCTLMPHPAQPSAPLDITEVNSFAPGLLVSQVSLGSLLPSPININKMLEHRPFESTCHRQLLDLERLAVLDALVQGWVRVGVVHCRKRFLVAP